MIKGRKVYDPLTDTWSTGYWVADDKGNYYPVWQKGVGMERLTDIINGWTFEETIKSAESLMEAEKNMFKWDVLRHLRDFAENYRERIKEYQQLEEQGRLLKLPCKVGDKIFLDFAGFGKDIDKFTVKDFHLDCFEDGETTLFCDYESNDKALSGQIDVMEFGKTVFLTKAEVEAKLKELRGGE